MFYDIRNNAILNDVPLDGYLTDGSLVQGLNIADVVTQQNCGIYAVKSATPQPPNTLEDINRREVFIENDGVTLTRFWVSAPPPAIPETISARQIRLWLIDNNIGLTSVETAIDTIVDEKLREKTRVEWEYAPYIERTHPLIENLAAHLNLTPAQIDQGFIDASVL